MVVMLDRCVSRLSAVRLVDRNIWVGFVSLVRIVFVVTLVLFVCFVLN